MKLWLAALMAINIAQAGEKIKKDVGIKAIG
jgi:hypothetical protein